MVNDWEMPCQPCFCHAMCAESTRVLQILSDGVHGGSRDFRRNGSWRLPVRDTDIARSQLLVVTRRCPYIPTLVSSESGCITLTTPPAIDSKRPSESQFPESDSPSLSLHRCVQHSFLLVFWVQLLSSSCARRGGMLRVMDPGRLNTA